MALDFTCHISYPFRTLEITFLHNFTIVLYTAKASVLSKIKDTTVIYSLSHEINHIVIIKDQTLAEFLILSSGIEKARICLRKHLEQKLICSHNRQVCSEKNS